MKKFLFLMLTISVITTVSAQTVLNRFPIELKKSSDYFQIINAENTSQEYFSFITDKQKITVLKYNSALFFTDSLSDSRPEKDLDFMIGATFSANGSPNLYCSSRDFESIKMLHFDFENHSTFYLLYENDFTREKVIDAFVADNKFNIVSINSDNKLKFSNFSYSGKNEYVLAVDSKNTLVEPNTRAAISDNGIAVIETNIFAPLYMSVAKVKRYLNAERYILSVELETSTVLYTVNLKDFTLKKEEFPYEKLDKDSGSNSFLHQGVLYQISANSESISLSGIDLKTKNNVGTYQANAKQEIDFKNSPLLLQSDNGKTREIKNTSKFLSKMNYGTVGLSIYSTPNYNLFTIGGIRSVASTGNIVLGVGFVLGGLIGGEVVAPLDFIDTDNSQSIYFESFFDANFKHVKTPFRPLYIDSLGEFLYTNQSAAQNIYPYKNFVILNYYDSKAKEFVMRKFEDITN